MREALDRLNRELERDWGVSIQLRTGVNTGEVATGDQSADGLVLGDAVNVAARLEQAAGPQEILLGPATYRLVAGAVEAEPLAPMALKGKGVLVEAHRVVRLRPDARTRVRRFDTPLVGRDAEHAVLLGAFERAVAERTCHVVRVIGDAGVGKSRLLAELTHDVASRARVAHGACPSYGDGITFLPVAEVIGRLAGVGEDDDVVTARAKLASVLSGDGVGAGTDPEGVGVEGEDAEQVVDQVAELLGLAPAATGSEELFRAVRKTLEAAARREPLVVVLEDVQWGQPTFFDLIEHIVEWVREAPLLVCCAARRELREVAPGWGEGHDRFHDVELSPLPPADSRALLDELLEGPGLSPAVARTLVEVADGNPLYLEELVAMLLDDGLLRREGEAWVAAGDLREGWGSRRRSSRCSWPGSTAWPPPSARSSRWRRPWA